MTTITALLEHCEGPYTLEVQDKDWGDWIEVDQFVTLAEAHTNALGYQENTCISTRSGYPIWAPSLP